MDLYAELHAIVRALNVASVQYALAGGLAVLPETTLSADLDVQMYATLAALPADTARTNTSLR